MTRGSKYRLVRQRSRGFSLVEVVIATGIFALVAVLLFTTLWSGHAQVARLEKAGSQEERLLAARRVLTSWLEAATVAGTADAGVFVGERQMMVFNASPADRQAMNGLYRIELRLERDGEGARGTTRLSVRRQRLGVGGTPQGPATEAETTQLLATPRRLGFAYGAEKGTGPDGYGQRWTDTWPQTDAMPTRIQIRDSDGTVLTATVAISKDPRCILRRGPDMLAGGECLVR